MDIVRSSLRHGNLYPDIIDFLMSLNPKLDFSREYDKGPVAASYSVALQRCIQSIENLAESLKVADQVSLNHPKEDSKNPNNIHEIGIKWRLCLKDAQLEMNAYHDTLCSILESLSPKSQRSDAVRVFKNKVKEDKKVFASPINKSKHNQRIYNFMAADGINCVVPGYFMTSAGHGEGQVEVTDQDVNPSNIGRSLYRETSLYLYFLYVMAKETRMVAQATVRKVHGVDVAVQRYDALDSSLERTIAEVQALPRQIFKLEEGERYPEVKLESKKDGRVLTIISQSAARPTFHKSPRTVAGFDRNIRPGSSAFTLPRTD